MVFQQKKSAFFCSKLNKANQKQVITPDGYGQSGEYAKRGLNFDERIDPFNGRGLSSANFGLVLGVR
ncbi:hypothetical protein GWI33_015292 [Rhynchophorus ferrugineus]|uniref:Uncharacterized protein n=1 Tax=Rhynchophorus ferrugineus TaxID=354439 RepID=A0A834M647_RHYFE|nr:hypothetical protein GWI33_015292 [Rhynchophorus ferrugineus]